MHVLALDLAERYSAAILLKDGEVAAEFAVDFGQRDEPWTEKCVRVEMWWDGLRNELAALGEGDYRIIIEDVYPFAAQPKWIYRIQGILMWLIERDGYTYEWCLPLKWQRYFGYKKVQGRTSKVWAKEVAAERGYVPDAKGKARIDLQDAFLIALWGKETCDAEEGTNSTGAGSVEVAK